MNRLTPERSYNHLHPEYHLRDQISTPSTRGRHFSGRVPMSPTTTVDPEVGPKRWGPGPAEEGWTHEFHFHFIYHSLKIPKRGDWRRNGGRSVIPGVKPLTPVPHCTKTTVEGSSKRRKGPPETTPTWKEYMSFTQTRVSYGGKRYPRTWTLNIV